MDVKKLLGQLSVRRKSARETVLRLARQAAAGGKQTPDVAEIEAALAAAGISAEHFGDIAQKAAEKRRLASEAATAAKLQKRKGELQGRIRAADTELEAAETKHAETIGPCVWELEDLEAELQRASDAEQRARRIVVDDEAATEHAKVSRERAAAGDEVQRLADEAAYAESQRREATARATVAATADDEYKRRQANEEAEKLGKRAAHFRGKLAKAQEQFDRLGEQLEPLRQRLEAF